MTESNVVPVSKKARLEALLERGELADCLFIIDDVVIKAHKLLLACSSPVFEKMFYGDLASDRIVITDITPEDFKQMLQFVYTDKIEIKSVVNAWSLLYISHKYLLNDLSSICETYVEHNLTINNLVLNYEYAEMYDISDIQDKCIRDICEYSRGIFCKNYDYHMKDSTLLTVLKQYIKQFVLNADSNNLFDGIITWAVYECDKKNIQITPENIVHLLNSTNILEYVLMIDFDIGHFEGQPLSLEVCKLLKKAAKPLEPRMDWKDHWFLYCKSRQVYKIAGRADLRERDCLTSNITVNKKVLLFGLVIITEDEKMGSVSGRYNGKIVIQIRNIKNSEIISHTSYADFLPFETPVYISLNELVYLEPNESYVIKVSYTNLDNVNDLGVRKSSVLCNYMSNTLQDEKRKIVFTFQELNGGVIKGICYYPA